VVVAVMLGIVIAAGMFPVALPSAGASPTLRVSTLSLPGLAASAPLEAVTELQDAPHPLTVVAPDVSEDTIVLARDGTEAAVAAIEQAQSEGATVVAAIPSVAPPAREPRYVKYAVRPGDTVSSIARRFAIDSDYIVWNNADVSNDPDSLEVGQELQIPTLEGMIHSVEDGDTLSSIIRRYDGDLSATLAFRANNINDPNVVPEGQLLLVIGGRNIPPPAPTFRPSDSVDFGGNWVWPTAARTLTSWFGVAGHNLGIDVAAMYGSQVVAVETGRVTFVGGDPCCSYGYHVIVDHGNNFKSVYAHLSRFNVELGDQVVAGQQIGQIGTTGRSTGPHLHFEIRRNGIHQNPLNFLP
jgi:murein DD-endopeptidase MepM/ murein hydrolase activator NlpD